MIGGLLIVVAAGCTAGSSESPSLELDRATAAVLADGADRLADALADDDPCRALLEADALRERAARALEEGEAPASVATETARVVDATTADLSCEPVTAAGEDPDDVEGEGGEAEGDAGDTAAAGSDPEQESAPPAEDTAAGGSSEPSPTPPAEDGDAGGGDEGKEEPPGKAKGHDGGGGPPDDRGKGRGNG